ncbi:MAG: sterol desaturase [Nitrospinae bacterium CG11_big_fil_rev_8_21_14_0_20_45_15]|nr:MAG: sterol desaturase [Nitrospinae bacterium CG11_big_fil_rev_8_21_14_0_20_45_15]
MDVATIRFSIFLGVFVLMLALEAMIPRHPTVDSKLRRLGINLAITGIDILVVRLFLGTAAIGAAQFAEVQGWGMLNWTELPPAIEIFFAVVFLDFMIYVQHVVVHMIPFFWQFHIVHHTDLDLDVSSGLRFHPIEILGSLLFKIVLIFSLGASPVAVLIFEAILNGMAQFSHSNIKLRDDWEEALRKVIVTPDMHRIHHSVERAETNSNYGFNLSLWDRWLGTYIARAKKLQPDIVIGVPEYRKPEEVGLLKLLLMPFKRKGPSYFSGDIR